MYAHYIGRYGREGSGEEDVANGKGARTAEEPTRAMPVLTVSCGSHVSPPGTSGTCRCLGMVQCNECRYLEPKIYWPARVAIGK